MICKSHFARTWVAIVCIGALALTGCGGPKVREARYTRRGQEYLAQQQFEKARVEFRNALQIDPTSARLRYYNGLVDEKLGNIQEAVQFYRAAIDIDPDQVQAREQLGRLLVLAGVSDLALEQAKLGLAKHPDDVALLVVRGVARQKKEPDAALKDLQRAVSLAPSNEDAIATLAGMEVYAGQTDQARRLVEAAVARLPGSADLRSVLVQLYLRSDDRPGAERTLLQLTQLRPREPLYRVQLARVYAGWDRVDDAERTLRAAIKDIPGDITANGLVEFLWERRGHDVAEAELKRMIQAAPRDVELRFMLATLLQRSLEPARAEVIYKDLIDGQGSNGYGLRARDELAALYIGRNDYQRAQKLVTEVLQENPADGEALALRASEELWNGDAEASITDLRRVLRGQPNSVKLLTALADAYVVDGEPQLAEDTARRAVELDPADLDARIMLARVLFGSGRFDEAQPILSGVLKQRPHDVTVLQLLYEDSLGANDTPTARMAAKELATSRPDLAVGFVDLGLLAQGAGNGEEALADYHRAFELQPDALEPLTMLVRLLETTHRFDEAIRLLDDTARSNPKSPLPPCLKGEVLVAERHHLPEAAAAFRLALTLSPRWWNPYSGLAAVELVTQGPTAASAVLHSAVSHADLSEKQRIELAGLLSAAGDHETAIEQYETALKLNPRSRNAAAALAMLLVSFRTDQPSLMRAAALVQTFGNSRDWRLLDAFGWVQFKNEDFRAALTSLEQAAALQPNVAQVRFHLAMAELKTGQQGAAEKDLAAALAPETPFFGHDEAHALLAQLRSTKPEK